MASKEPIKIIVVIKIGDKEYSREEREISGELVEMTRERHFQLEHSFGKPVSQAVKNAFVKFDSEKNAQDS